MCVLWWWWWWAEVLTPCLPGMVQCQTMRFTDPSATVSGFATNPCESVGPDQDTNPRPGPGPGPGWEAKRGGMRRYGHGGGSCAKPCAPPRGGRARSLLPTWAAAGEVALLLSADQIRFRSLRRWWDDDELVLSFLSLEKSNLVRKFLLAPELHQKFHFYV
jgi:hypothetical protein